MARPQRVGRKASAASMLVLARDLAKDPKRLRHYVATTVRRWAQPQTFSRRVTNTPSIYEDGSGKAGASSALSLKVIRVA